MRLPILFLLLVSGLICPECTQKTGKIIGVKIYEYLGDYDELAGKWADIGINTAFVSTSLAANDTFRRAQKNNIVYVIFPVFGIWS
jgi:hypothetical protein